MSEEAVKEIIEQVGYQEFYRYFQEKTTLIEQQRREIERLKGALQTHEILLQSNTKEIERLNNDIKELLKENGNKEKVIKAQDNIIKEVREKIKEFCWDYEYETYSNMTSDEVKELAELLDKEVN